MSLAEKQEIKVAERRELIYTTLRELNITDQDFISELMDDDWIPLYYSGRIRVPPIRMRIRLERRYGKYLSARCGAPMATGGVTKRRRSVDGVITSQKIARDKGTLPVAPAPAPPAPQKKRKLTEDDYATRKRELIARLARMGVPEEKIEFDDPDEVAYQWIHGLTSDDIGPVAGAIWRKNKPVFTGIGFKTCQREEDLQRLAPKTDYSSD